MSADGVTVRTPAKLNLHLEVVGRREDGYHDLSTVMHAIDLYDEITLRVDPDPDNAEGAASSKIELTCEPPVTAVPRENLVWRAAHALLTHPSVPPWVTDWPGSLRFHVEKHIPAGGGLGGGSSDAAATLRVVDRGLRLHAEPACVREIAASLGADVPFFLSALENDGTALCEGIGDRVTPLPDAPRLRFAILEPTFGCDTAAVFRALRLDLTAPRALDSVSALSLLRSDWSRTEPFNRLAETVLRLYPRLAELRAWFGKRAGRPVQVTGSGSCLFAVWSEDETGPEPSDFSAPPDDVARIHFAASA